LGSVMIESTAAGRPSPLVKFGRPLAPFVAVVALAGCGGGESESASATDAAATATTEAAAHSNADWATVASDPDAYEGDPVELVGRVFNVQRDADAVVLQVWMDPKNSELNTIVGYDDPTFKVAERDYVRVVGSVKGKYEGENAFGAKITVPTVTADMLRVVDAAAAATPAHTTYKPLSSTEGGIRMTVRKIEAAPDETRVYVTVQNPSASDFSFYSSNAKLVANGQSIKTTYGGDYKEPASDVPAQSRTAGVIVFEAVPRDAALRLLLEGYSDNSDVGDYGTLKWTFTWR